MRSPTVPWQQTQQLSWGLSLGALFMQVCEPDVKPHGAAGVQVQHGGSRLHDEAA